MPRFQEVESGQAPPSGGSGLVAKRYNILQSLGRGSFGSVYLVQDTRAADGEKLKVLKQIPLGDLRPDETVRATQEAQLLSQLHHPAILTFYHSFLERDAFCIITEYCQDRDLDWKLEEVRRAGRSLPEIQVIDWFIQLLLGLHYMHDRRILHRDLKAKNVFLKQNLVKIGDFGVSCLLMGSCDLATTFTGTPYYMSPEVVTHQGYDSKSDIWALGCLLFEMCCLTHAFRGPSFLSVVMKIVEGETPTLPASFSPDLNSVLQRMLHKQPSSRPSAAELLKTKFMERHMQLLIWSVLVLVCRALGCLLFEMCCLTHAFRGPSFLSVVMKIVEGETPTLPASFSPDLNSVLQRMLHKQPSSRPSAAELLKTKFMERHMQKMKIRFEFVSSGGEEDAQVIAKNMQTKVHLQTLRERSEVEKMTPRERMRLRKLQAADEKARRLRKLAEKKYEEIHTRRRELRSRHFEKISVDVLNESREGGACQTLIQSPIRSHDHRSAGGLQPIERQDESEPELHDIPEDPQAAEVYYNQDGFDSCSEDEETETPAETLYLSDPQVSELEAMMKHMQKVLEEELSGDPVEPEAPQTPQGPRSPQTPQGPQMINSSLLETRIQHLRESACRRLGSDVFQQLYENLKEARRRREVEDEDSVTEDAPEDEPDVGFQVDQLLFLEGELQRVRRLQEYTPPV
ncbi:serine/threonine-protein kinase Nek11-like [Seriola dumerili]|uniref:serine/threonine-protein kinase Nek11-like n=1 Tax=Seriola dumerili TaxID=41447 RepID=UPI000BBF0828|nr:serine/threonine-protein kinase Nek11-like [Seriola dumerili]